MRKDVLSGAAFMVLMGTALIVLGTVVAYYATSEMNDPTSSTYHDYAQGLENVMKGSLIQSLGTVIALTGIAMGFIGATLSESADQARIERVPVCQYVYEQRQQPHQQFQ